MSGLRKDIITLGKEIRKESDALSANPDAIILVNWLKTQEKNIENVKIDLQKLPNGKPIIYFDKFYECSINTYGVALYKIDDKSTQMGGYGRFFITNPHIRMAISHSKDSGNSLKESLLYILQSNVTKNRKKILERMCK